MNTAGYQIIASPLRRTLNQYRRFHLNKPLNFKKIADKLYVSAKTGDGLDVLKNMVKKVLGINPAISDTLSITTSRQQGALLTCQKRINNVGSLLEEHPVSYELISIELREALDSIASILGKTTPDDILNNIFNQFCVGK